MKQPRPPTTILMQYETESYELYDAKKGNAGAPVTDKFTSFDQYAGYALYVNIDLNRQHFREANIPTQGVRLDDRTAVGARKECGIK